MRKIVAVTGIRSEYDIMSSVYEAIRARGDLDLSLIVTGAHLSKTFGLTVEEIRKDGFVIAETVESLLNGDNDATRIKGAAIQLYGLAQAVDRIRPDWLLVLGDREESITTALVGAYLNIPIAHIGGGDRVIGNVDDQVRHAVTKLAHLHFATNQESYERILRLGEQPFRVFNFGNPGLDRLVTTSPMPREDVLNWYGFEPKTFNRPLLVVIQHVISSESDQAYAQMKITMEAVKSLGLNTVMIYPNSDAGSQEIIRCIGEYEGIPHLRVRRNIPRLPFVNTLREASCLLGNSSCGLLEAPFLKIPVVNVGNRQKARLHAENVQFVSHETGVIIEAVKKACFDESYRKTVEKCSNFYGDGRSSEKIAAKLAKIEFTPEFLIKDITY